MPDLKKLHGLLGRTQMAWQNALNNGDQQGANMYEGYLDRLHSVAEKALNANAPGGAGMARVQNQDPGLQGPGGDTGTTGAAGIPSGAPQLPQDASNGQRTSLGSSRIVPVDPSAVSALNGNNYSANLANESQPTTGALKTLMTGIPPNAKQPDYIGPSTGYSPTPPQGGLWDMIKEGIANGPDTALTLSGTPSFEGKAPPTVQELTPNFATLGSALKDTANWLVTPKWFLDDPQSMGAGYVKGTGDSDPQLGKGGRFEAINTPTGTSASDPEYTPGPDTSSGDSHNPYDDETRPSAYQPPQADFKTRFKQAVDEELGKEPQFFNFHRLAQLLLVGAQGTMNQYDKEKNLYQQGKIAIANRLRGQDWQKSGDSQALAIAAMRNKIEMQRAQMTFAPEAAKAAMEPHLKAAEGYQKQLDAYTNKIADLTPEQKSDVNRLRQAMEQEYNAAVEQRQRYMGH